MMGMGLLVTTEGLGMCCLQFIKQQVIWQVYRDVGEADTQLQ
jgi:hypothetical protein